MPLRSATGRSIGAMEVTMLQEILSRISQSGTTPEPESKQEESPQARYVAVVRGLVHDAYQQKQIVPLMNVLTWALAGIAHDFGPSTIADILGRLGGHMRQIAAETTAQADADAAKRS